MEDNVLKELAKFIYTTRQATNQFVTTNFPFASPSMIRVMHYLMEHQKDQVTNKDLEVNLGLGKATVSEILNKMETNHVIERVVDEHDARKKLIKVCAPKNHDKIDACMEDVNLKLVEGVDKEDLEVFLKVLHQIRDNIRKEMNHD